MRKISVREWSMQNSTEKLTLKKEERNEKHTRNIHNTHLMCLEKERDREREKAT